MPYPIKSTVNAAVVLALSGVAMTASAQSTAPAEAENELETITVVGSSIRISPETADTTALPVQIISREAINRTSGQSVANFLQDLPINNGGVTSRFTDEGGGGTSGINLRGFGEVYTLVLVDGVRLLSGDVGAIPPEAIESVDILKSGASSLYGADAVAGVVNIRLRRKLNGLELSSSFGDTTRNGDGSTFQTAAVYGFKRNRFDFTGSFTYQDSDEILKFDRELTASRDYRRFGGINRNTENSGFPHRIDLLDSDENIVDSLSIDLSRFGPGDSSLDPNDFVAFRESQQLATNEISTFPKENTVGTHWSARYAFIDDALTLYSSGYLNRRRQNFIFVQSQVNDLFVPEDNFYNPFGQDALVAYTFGANEIGPFDQSVIERLDGQGTVGLEGKVGRFNYNLSYTYHRLRFDNRQSGLIFIDIEDAVARTDATAFNPFCFQCNSGAQLAGLAGVSNFDEVNHAQQVDALISGEWFTWQPGTAYFSVGLQYRDSDFRFTPSAINQTRILYVDGEAVRTDAGGGDQIKGVFGEVRLPVYQNDDAVFLQSAEIGVATRYEDYSTFGSQSTSQISGKLGFADDSFAVRISAAESFRAPSAEDLFGEEFVETFNPGGLFDPVAGGPRDFTFREGGNPNLRPEEGISYNLGFILKPRSLPTLFTTLDYWRIELDDVIAQPNAQALLFGTATSGSLTRPAPTPDDPDPAPILDLRIANGGDRQASGLDYYLKFDPDAGRLANLDFFLAATYLFELEDFANGIRQVYVGEFTPGDFNAVPKLRTAAGATWAVAGFSADATVNYSSGYKDFLALPIVDDDGIQIGEDVVADRRVGSYTTLDLQFGYDFDEAGNASEGFVSGLSLNFGIENVFDNGLKFIAESGDGWDRSIQDYRGRYVYAGVRKKFN
jgi:iron complex outermembrane recepter protein